MLRIAVCDDNEEFLQDVVAMIERWSAESGISVDINSFQDGDALLTYTETHRMDIILLDIIMPLLNGMETAKELRRKDTAICIIFLTSSPEFALESYEVKAKGYLIKPVSYERLQELLDECTRGLKEEAKHLIVKTKYGYQKIYYHEVEYIEVQNKKVLFFLKNGKSIEIAGTFHYFESKLNNEEGFFKCHRSYMVYIPNVDHFNVSEIVTGSGYHVPIARGFGKAFKEAYFAYMFQK